MPIEDPERLPARGPPWSPAGARGDGISDAVVDSAVAHVLYQVGKIIDKDYADAYLAPLFENIKKCADICSKYEKL